MSLPLRTGWLVLLGALTAIAPMSTDMYLPAFPAITAALQLPAGGMELSFSSYFVGVLLGILCYGPLSDRYGRKPPLLFGLALYSLASLAITQVDSLAGLVGWRFLQGLGGCAGTVLTTAIVRDRCAPQDTARVLSRIMLVMGLAPILAPLAGGLLLALWGWQSIFLVLTVFGLGCLLAVYALLDETLAPAHVQPLHPGAVLRRYGRLLTNRIFVGYLLSQAFAAGAMFAYIAGSPFVLLDLHGIAPSHYGLFFGLNGIGLLLASQLNRRLLRRHHASLLLARALWAPLTAGVLLLVAELAGLRSLALLMLAFFVLVSSIGLVNPNASAMAMAGQAEQAGSAAALLGATTFGMGMLGGAFIGFAHDGSGLPLALVIAGMGSAAWLANRLLLGARPTVCEQPA
ncbi:Bicyclomycin resistance protein [compost metagenome]